MYSRASQRSKFTAPFVSPTMNNSMKPSTQQRQLGRDEKTQNDIIGVTHECYQGLKPKSPRRKLYTFKGPLDTLEVLQSGVGSSREKRYLIPPDQNKKTKYQPEVYEDVTNPVDITSTCRPSAVGHVHQAFNGRSPNKQDSHRKSAYNERKVLTDFLYNN